MTLPLISAHVAGIVAKSGGITLDPIAKPLAAVLAFFYGLIPNYGIAIGLLTVAMMIVLTPLTIKQTRSMLVMQKLQPQLKRLQETHKNDRQALNEAVMALYKEHNASPLGGCLPMLLPLPVFFALLRVLEGLSRQVHGQSVPKYLTTHTRMFIDIQHAKGQLDAFGMNLAKSASNAGGGFAHKAPFFVLLVLMIGTQYFQQWQLTSRNPQASTQPGQQAMMKFIPLFFGLISIRFPAGVVIYWTLSNMIRILQQWAMYRYDPKVKALVVKDIKEVEARTREIDAEKKSGRPRLRDMLGNAASAAAARNDDDKKPGGSGGKGAANPGNKPGGAKGSNGTKGGRSTASTGKSASAGKAAAGGRAAPTGKASPGASGKSAGAGTGKAGPAGTGKAVSAGNAAPAGKITPAGAKPPADPKPGGRRAAPTKSVAGGNGGAPPNSPAAKSGGAGAAAKPVVDGGGTGAAPTNGGSRDGGSGSVPGGGAAQGADTVAGANGNSTGSDETGGPEKGRTGGTSSRNVNKHRRRRGR